MIGSVDNKLTASSTMIQSFPNVRLFLVCFASNAVAHPVGIVSVAKLWLFGGALAGVICGSMGRRDVAANLPGLASFMILVAMAVIAASALWGTGSTREVLTALAKNGKRLTDPIFVFSPIPSRGFLRNRFLCGRAGFFAAQHLGKVLLTFGSLGHFESVWPSFQAIWTNPSWQASWQLCAGLGMPREACRPPLCTSAGLRLTVLPHVACTSENTSAPG